MENVSLFIELANEVKRLKEEIEKLKEKKSDSSLDQSDIEEMIQSYIDENPSEIRESLDFEGQVEDCIRDFLRNI